MTRNLFVLAALSLGTTALLPAVAAGTPTPAPAVISTVTPELMVSIVKGAGYTVTLDKSGDNPELTLKRKDSDVVIYLNLHDCKTGSCSEADAYTYYAAEDLSTAPTESDMTSWNSKNYTQAYIDSEDDDSVNLDTLYYFKGGFTKANFLNWLNEFKKDADAFDKMLQDL